jgi:hypothetical protein
MSPDPDQPLQRRSATQPPAGGSPAGGERPCPMVDRMLLLAGASPDWRVGVVGPAGPATMIALCRKGFDRAMSVAGGVCPKAEGGCDLMLVTGPTTAEALNVSVPLALSLLRDGGVLVVHEAGLKDDSLIGAALRAAGREPGWCVHDMAEGCLVALQVLRTQPAAAVPLAASHAA